MAKFCINSRRRYNPDDLRTCQAYACMPGETEMAEVAALHLFRTAIKSALGRCSHGVAERRLDTGATAQEGPTHLATA